VKAITAGAAGRGRRPLAAIARGITVAAVIAGSAAAVYAQRGMAAVGTGSSHAVGAVLLYRIITFKIAGLIWVAYLCLRQRAHWR
jgi:hypothetical protein